MIRRRYRFHLPGVLFAGVTLLMGVGAINSQNNLLFLLFGAMLGAVVVSGFVSGSMMMNVRVERVGVDPGGVDQPVRIRYRVRNVGRRLPVVALTVGESRGFGAGWSGVMRAPSGFVGMVPAGGEVEVVGSCWPLRRGVARLGGVVASSGFPFGLLEKRAEVESEGLVVVRPRVVRLVRDPLASGARGVRAGESRRRSRSRGEEFFQLRDYREGDPLNMMAWRSSARTGELVVRETSASTARRVWVDVRLEGGEAGDEDVEEAVSLAASVLADTFRRGGAGGLMLEGRVVSAVTDSPAGLGAMLDHLAAVGTDGADSALRASAEGAHEAVATPSARDTVVRVSAGRGSAGVGGGDVALTGGDLARLGGDAGRIADGGAAA